MSSQLVVDNSPKIHIRKVMLPKLSTIETDYYPFTLLLPVIVTDDLDNNNYIWTLKASKVEDSQLSVIKDITEPVDYPIKIELSLFKSPHRLKAKCFLQLCTHLDTGINTDEAPSMDMVAGSVATSILITPNDLSIHKSCYGDLYYLKIIIIVDSIQHQAECLPESREHYLLRTDTKNEYKLHLTLKPSPLSLRAVETLELNLKEWSEKSPFFYVLACKFMKEMNDSEARQVHLDVLENNDGSTDNKNSRFDYTIEKNNVEYFKLFVDGGHFDNYLTNEELLGVFSLASSLQLTKFKKIYEDKILIKASEYEKPKILIVAGHNFYSYEIEKIAIKLWKKKNGESDDDWLEQLRQHFPDEKQLANYVFAMIHLI